MARALASDPQALPATACYCQGVARALVLAAEDWARLQGVQQLYVHVVADNLPARQLYMEVRGSCRVAHGGAWLMQGDSCTVAHAG